MNWDSIYMAMFVLIAKLSPSSSSIGLTGYKLTLFLQKQKQQDWHFLRTYDLWQVCRLVSL